MYCTYTVFVFINMKGWHTKFEPGLVEPVTFPNFFHYGWNSPTETPLTLLGICAWPPLMKVCYLNMHSEVVFSEIAVMYHWHVQNENPCGLECMFVCVSFNGQSCLMFCWCFCSPPIFQDGPFVLFCNCFSEQPRISDHTPFPSKPSPKNHPQKSSPKFIP